LKIRKERERVNDGVAFIILVVFGILLLMSLHLGEDDYGLEYGDTYDFYDDSLDNPYQQYKGPDTDH
jgi:hypothetical protein